MIKQGCLLREERINGKIFLQKIIPKTINFYEPVNIAVVIVGSIASEKFEKKMRDKEKIRQEI